jgi:hypothetical protein
VNAAAENGVDLGENGSVVTIPSIRDIKARLVNV